MNRHEECILDGCEKLKAFAEAWAKKDKADILGVVMGLHVYNVLLLINGENANQLIQPDAVKDAGPLSWSGCLCQIDDSNPNSMPVFTFERREK